MNKKIILMLPLLGALVGCSGGKIGSKDFEKFKKEFAITEYNNEDFTLTQDYTTDYETFGDFYKKYDNVYGSFYSDKTVEISNPQTFSLASHRIIYDSSKYICYDLFGEEFPFLYKKYKFDVLESYYMLASKDSGFYKHFTADENANDEGLALFRVYEIEDSFYSTFYSFRLESDTRLLARNTFQKNDVYYDIKDWLIPLDSEIEKINDKEYKIKTDGITNRYYYVSENSNNFFSNVKRETLANVETNINQNYTIYLAGGATYYFKLVEVTEISNDFDVVYNGQKYKCITNLDIETKCFPLSYIYSKDKTYAYILCHKIDGDGNISNKYYVFKVDNRGRVSAFSEDISIFNNSQKYVKLEKNYYLLNSNQQLIFLRDNILCTYESNEKLKITEKQGTILRHFNLNKYLGYSVDNKYYFLDTHNVRIASYNIKNGSFSFEETSSFITTTNIIIHINNESLYVFDNYICDSSKYLNYTQKSVQIAGLEVSSTILHIQNSSYVFKLTQEKGSLKSSVGILG